MVSQALDTLTSMSATAKLQTKKYMGECKFLFLTIAHITKIFSRRLTMPRVRNTSAAMTTCSHGDDLLLTVGTVKLLPKALRFSSETYSCEDVFMSGSKHFLFSLRDLPTSVVNAFSKRQKTLFTRAAPSAVLHLLQPFLQRAEVSAPPHPTSGAGDSLVGTDDIIEENE